jgi:hypothetical protein
MIDNTAAATKSYEIVSVKRTSPAPDPEGSVWHSYVISYEGKDNIHGCRQGSLKAVTMAVEEIVDQLNERHVGHFRKPGRVQLVLTPTDKK